MVIIYRNSTTVWVDYDWENENWHLWEPSSVFHILEIFSLLYLYFYTFVLQLGRQPRTRGLL